MTIWLWWFELKGNHWFQIRSGRLDTGERALRISNVCISKPLGRSVPFVWWKSTFIICHFWFFWVRFKAAGKCLIKLEELSFLFIAALHIECCPAQVSSLNHRKVGRWERIAHKKSTLFWDLLTVDDCQMLNLWRFSTSMHCNGNLFLKTNFEAEDCLTFP